MAEPSTRAKWRALRSARVGALKKCLTGTTLSERRCFNNYIGPLLYPIVEVECRQEGASQDCEKDEEDHYLPERRQRLATAWPSRSEWLRYRHILGRRHDRWGGSFGHLWCGEFSQLDLVLKVSTIDLLLRRRPVLVARVE